jgi:hypothetical protein
MHPSNSIRVPFDDAGVTRQGCSDTALAAGLGAGDDGTVWDTFCYAFVKQLAPSELYGTCFCVASDCLELKQSKRVGHAAVHMVMKSIA